jgi:5-methylcytosine-specific restriction endonuclease McrA
MTDSADVYCADSGQYLGQCRMSDFNVLRMTDVVLTIAHLDHQPENCAPENLRAWCQRCHLRYDQQQHIANAQATRRSRLAVADLFEAERTTT